MAVIRVANATVGGDFGVILNKVLSHSTTWMAQQDGKDWQRFEVISDMGSTEQEQLARRISTWADTR